jgi:hypothetical protein
MYWVSSWPCLIKHPLLYGASLCRDLPKANNLFDARCFPILIIQTSHHVPWSNL